MAATRTLPEWRNPMLEEERAPAHEILVERRCLGQTELKVKTGQIGTSNATKPENLGVLDYAHLRVPLPKDLSQSGIFSKGSNRKYPEAYFLMRRSSDGYISATGLFKAAFPYASVEEENAEKEYIKTLPTTSTEEVAGNVWIHPDEALALSDEYGIRLWVAALLDSQPITHGTDKEKDIKSPPTYRNKDLLNMANGGLGSVREAKTPGRRSTRGARSMRSESPTKPSKGSERVKATPRKPTRGRKELASVDELTTTEAPEAPESVNGELHDTVRVEVETVLRTSETGEEEVESTKAIVEMPYGHPDLPLPDNAEEMVAQARMMVQDAERISGPSTGVAKRKLTEREEDMAIKQPAKRLRRMEVELRKERVKKRALMGITAVLAFGALIPNIVSALPWP